MSDYEKERAQGYEIFLNSFIKTWFSELHYKYSLHDILDKIEDISDPAIQDIVRLAYNLCLKQGIFDHWDSDDFPG